jgi:hypothetical protein
LARWTAKFGLTGERAAGRQRKQAAATLAEARAIKLARNAEGGTGHEVPGAARG